MTRQYAKGDVVLVSAEVMTAYLHKDTEEEDSQYYTEQGWEMIHRPDERGSLFHASVKCLFKRPVFERGLVIGYRRKATGHFYPERYYGPDIDPAYLAQDRRFLVVVVEPLHSRQWIEPWLCLPEDVARIQEEE